MNKPQNTTQNIVVPNSELEVLKQHFPHCFDKNGDFDFEKFKKELATSEINFSKESYGMDWLGKSYARLLATDPAKTLIKEDTAWNDKEENKNSENLLIKGDNLEVLKHLSNAYHEKVKMIYIDPPYNTGSDGFVYEDDRKFTVEEFSELVGVDEEQAKKILSFVNSKSNSHSAWLTFMYPRLYIARQLLDDGAIFVSIDDNEVAQLRILMDDIFGEDNFVGQFKWNRVAKAPSLSENIRTKYEYIICYKKGNLSKFFGKQSYNTQGPVWHNPNKQKELLFPANTIKVPGSFEKGSKSEKYQVELLDSIVEVDGLNKFPVRIKACAAWGQEKINQYIEDGNLFQIKKDIGTLYAYLPQGENNFIAPSDLISKEECGVDNNTDASAELDKLGVPFTNPKPASLVKYLINMITHEESSAIILDFFAGSGTTGDAVMQLNAEDRGNGKEGNRKYILVQLPEAIDPEKNKTAFDFVKNDLGIAEPTIFEITKERLVRAAKKIKIENVDQPAKSEKVKCEGFDGEHCSSCKGEHTIKIDAKKAVDLSKVDFGFKIIKTQTIWEDYEFTAKEFDTQSKLFDESKLSSEDLQTLLTTWKTYENIPLTESLESVNIDGYTGYYGNGRLYLMDKGFETKHLKELLNKIDEDTTFNPVSIIVFGYHFESKVLREIAENVSNYANKKKLGIDFITRY